MREHDEQVTFFDWVRLNREHAPNPQVRKCMKLCYSVPNGFYSKSCKVINDMKAEGLTKGILDINLDWPCWPTEGAGWWAGLRIEMKYRAKISAKIQAIIDTGDYIVDLSHEQKEKRQLLIESGHRVIVSYSAKQSIRAVFGYLTFDENDYQGIREFLR